MIIYKYPIKAPGTTELNVVGAMRILTAQDQRGEPMIWVIADPEDPTEIKYTITAYGTGQDMPRGLGRYVSTIQTNGGSLVWHIFKKEELI